MTTLEFSHEASIIGRSTQGARGFIEGVGTASDRLMDSAETQTSLRAVKSSLSISCKRL